MVFYGFLVAFFMCAPRAHAAGRLSQRLACFWEPLLFYFLGNGKRLQQRYQRERALGERAEDDTCTANCAANNPTGGKSICSRVANLELRDDRTVDSWRERVGGKSIDIGGYDQSWYNSSACPSGWNRPIFSGEGTLPGTKGTYFLDLMKTATGAWLGLSLRDCIRIARPAATASLGYMSAGEACTSFEFDHNYFHGLTFDFPKSCTVSGHSYPVQSLSG